MKSITSPVHLSNLKRIAESPAHYLDSIGKDEDKAIYRVGRLTHALTLGVQDGTKWCVFEGRRDGKKWDEFRAAHDGEDIFTTSEHKLAKAMADAVLACPLAAPLLRGEFELPVEWTDETGRRCATRGIDVLNRADAYTLELKTAVSSQPTRFTRDAIRMGYHAQGAWFRDAAHSLKAFPTCHYIVAVEKKSPHVVTVLRLTGRAIEEGKKLCRSWMETLKGCEESNQWPGYAQYIVDLDIADSNYGLVFDDEDDEVAA